MSDFQQLQKLLGEAKESLSKAMYSEGGVSSASGMTGQLGDSSAAVLMTDGVKRRKKDRLTKKSNVKPPPKVPDQNVTGIKTPGVTGLSAQQEDEYLWGDTTIENGPKKKNKRA